MSEGTGARWDGRDVVGCTPMNGANGRGVAITRSPGGDKEMQH